MVTLDRATRFLKNGSGKSIMCGAEPYDYGEFASNILGILPRNTRRLFSSTSERISAEQQVSSNLTPSDAPDASSKFQRAAQQRSSNVILEFFDFLLHNKNGG